MFEFGSGILTALSNTLKNLKMGNSNLEFPLFKYQKFWLATLKIIPVVAFDMAIC